ncbi:LysR family transcriptional regulator [Arthrobacter sp. NPDC090010]|uniref:LysR family transcriptional regulator n=1 Tax=Arthrobacter sp. NPDC090010 TaxID=3363942 RepID=UPI0038164876
MNIRRVALFLEVVDHGTVTAAAEAVQLAQPALSRQLKALQAELGIKLLEPSGQRLVLTPGGEAFVPIARELVRQQRYANQAVAVLRWGCVKELRCVATIATIRGVLSRYIAEAGTRIPMISARVGGHFGLDAELSKGADFVISPVRPSDDLEHELLGSGSLRVHVGQGHEWHGRASVDFSELEDRTLIVHPSQTVSRQILEEALARCGVTPGELLECEEGSNILALAAAGFGIGITTEPSGYGTWGCDLVDPGSAERTQTGLWMAWRPGHYAESWLREIAEDLRAFVENPEYVRNSPE